MSKHLALLLSQHWALGPIIGLLPDCCRPWGRQHSIPSVTLLRPKLNRLASMLVNLNAELKQALQRATGSGIVAELTASADVASAGFTDAADAAQVLQRHRWVQPVASPI